jgi:hypothetical protein
VGVPLAQWVEGIIGASQQTYQHVTDTYAHGFIQAAG